MKNTRRIEMPMRWLLLTAVSTAIAAAARKVVSFPERAKRPKNWAVWPGGASFTMSVRLAAWRGPETMPMTVPITTVMMVALVAMRSEIRRPKSY